MSTEISEAKQFGIEKKQAEELIGNLPQIKSEREVLIPQFDAVIKMDIDNPETVKKAREVRLLIQKNRTQGINVWHKTTKDYFLKGGQFVDAIKRKEVAVNERMEADLLQIEKHAEIQEQKRLKELQEKRVQILSKYVDDASDRDLSSMDDDVWNAYIETKKKEYNERIEAERKAEEDRIAKEKAEAEERERIRKENERLKKEAEERERLAKIEAEKRAKEEAERFAKAEAERKAREEKERKEREEYEAKLKAEREERERIEAELKAKAEAERKAKEEAEAKIQSELNKGDADKVNDLIQDLESLKSKYSFKSAKNKKMYADVSSLIDKVINHINK